MEQSDRRNLAAAMAGLSGALEGKPTLIKPRHGAEAAAIVALAEDLIGERRLPVKVSVRGAAAWFEPDHRIEDLTDEELEALIRAEDAEQTRRPSV